MALYRFYNLEQGRALAVVSREVRALLGDKPLALGLVEAVGYHLPVVPGYEQIHDRSTPSRANIAAYVRKGALNHYRFHDLSRRWRNTQHPGMHDPRSVLNMRVAGKQLVIAHAPPRTKYHDTGPAQAEFYRCLVDIMRPRLTPYSRRLNRMVLMDANDDPSGWPSNLASAIRGRVVGTHIDCAVARRMGALGLHYAAVVNGTPMLSDHHHCVAVETA